MQGQTYNDKCKDKHTDIEGKSMHRLHSEYETGCFIICAQDYINQVQMHRTLENMRNVHIGDGISQHLHH
eukprot:274302-Hanusia_phi.AAC.1